MKNQGIDRRFAELQAERARDGDTDAAREILQDFIGAIDLPSERTWNGPGHYVYARYIADAFEQVLEACRWRDEKGLSRNEKERRDKEFPNRVAIALGVKSSRPGRRKGTLEYDDVALAAAVQLLRRHDLEKTSAIETLELMTGADRSTIFKAVNRYDGLEEPDRFSEETLKSLARPYLKAVREILGS
jgi:hypothetical protein